MEVVEADRSCLEAAETVLRAWKGLVDEAAKREQSFEIASLEDASTDSTGGSEGAKAEYHA
ncbi:hypothetical protein [Sinorhizobium fredii]|uniref:hypothetical protein n=1 Tax=Rhizobium fredii TaxID=380 RepID=UPI000595611F|nr:hypothetical protein [Sinorhizobium fredii]WOS65227.1 hypothetical protein SFGR64A_27210 [Sinorhizobium fredii GR64]